MNIVGSTTLADIQRLAEQFANENLDDYTSRFRSRKDLTSSKEVNDPIWGTISLSPVEVIVLDSPLLQRLRYIRQLGVVHWVYPGAMHTRFEHTLGVLHQIQHLTSAINNMAIQKSIQPLHEKKHTRLLRLCALLHDVGHAVFSHVSEKAIQSLPSLAGMSADFSKEFRVENKQLSEIFAFYIIRSPAMKRLFAAIMERHGDFVEFDSNRDRNINILTEKISDAIIGRKIDNRLPLLHELISGPFDADKLDYFVRDARLAGTPSLLDISRLVQKIEIREFLAKDLPGELSSNVDHIAGKYCIFGIKWSGVAVLDELHLARILLYSKIYRHPKVTAVEQMLKTVIIMLSQVSSLENVIKLLYKYEDDAFLSLEKVALLAALGLNEADLSIEQVSRIDQAIAVLRDVRARRLAVKAFQIQRRYPADPLDKDEQQGEGLTDFLEDIGHPEKALLFRQRLLAEVEAICSLINPSFASNPVTRAKLESEIMLHAQGHTPGGSQIARAYLLPTSGQPTTFRQYTVNRVAWVDSYTSDQAAGYIFSKPELADIVYIAMELILRKDYKVRLPASALEFGKRGGEEIQSLKKQLATVGYFKNAPFDIRPITQRYKKADVQGRIENFINKVAGYQAPQVPNKAEKRKATITEGVENWVRQFDQDGEVECVLKLLDSFRMLDRADTVQGIRNFIESNEDFRGAIAIPFGDAKDSGSVQTYFSADLIGSHLSACSVLDEAVKSGENKPIIFIDDFLGSGGQAQDYLAAGFGVESLRKSLGEKRDMFGEEKIRYLKQCRVAFVFTAAWDDGVRNLKTVCQRLGLNAQIFRHLDEKQIPFAFDGCLNDIDCDIVAKFKARCEKIGRDLIQSEEENKRKSGDGKITAATIRKKQNERALGYGNRAMLLSMPYNVPTQSLTAIWSTGTVDSVEWSALLQRRKKQ